MEKRIIRRQPYYLIKVFMDGCLLLLSFAVAFYLKRGHFLIEARHQRYLAMLFASWLIITIFSKKFFLVEERLLYKRVKPFLTSWVVLVFMLTILLYVFGWYHLSRFIVYGTLFLFLASELIMVLIGTILKKDTPPFRITFQFLYMLAQPLFVLSAFVLVHYIHFRSLRIDDDYVLLFMGIFLVWIFSSFMTHRFKITAGKSYSSALFPFWTAQLASAGIVSVLIFLFHMPQFSRTVVLGTILALSVMENMIVTGRYFYRKKKQPEDGGAADREKEDHEKAHRPAETIEIEARKSFPTGRALGSELFKKKLKVVYLNRYRRVYDFLEKNLNLEKFDIVKSVFIYSRDVRNIELIENRSLGLLMNFERINHLLHINRNFSLVNNKLKKTGVFIGRFESQEQRRDKIYSKNPHPLAKGIDFLDFVFNRVLPKLPGIKRIYFFVTKGSNRPLSKTECLGRLYYCGFEVIAFQEVEGDCYFIAWKIAEPCRDPHPSYGLILKQPRVGRYGKIIPVYKIRTMHPFAEYIPNLILHMYQNSPSNRIVDDFRITSWGRVLRKNWIDEWPMLINWLKGDLKLVGVRPISEAFFQKWPEELKKERMKHKPGLIPPYYVDMPKSMKSASRFNPEFHRDVWESERTYLEQYRKKPRRTDLSYFFKALNNIIFHGAKSS